MGSIKGMVEAEKKKQQASADAKKISEANDAKKISEANNFGRGKGTNVSKKPTVKPSSSKGLVSKVMGGTLG